MPSVHAWKGICNNRIEKYEVHREQVRLRESDGWMERSSEREVESV